MELQFELKDQTLTRKDKCMPMANSQGYLRAYFKIPNVVSGTVMAHFKMMRTNSMVEETIPVVNGSCSVPDSLVKAGTLHVWLSITTSRAYIPTNCVPVIIGESGDTGTILPLPDRTINLYDDIVRMYKEILMHSSSSGNGNVVIEGKSLEYNWFGTSLGIRQSGQTEYQYVNLQGPKGAQGIQGIQGEKGDKGDSGSDGKVQMLDDYTNAFEYINAIPSSLEDVHLIFRIWSAYGVPTKFGYEDGRNNDFWFELFLTAPRDYGRLKAIDLYSSKTFIMTKRNGVWGEWEYDGVQIAQDIETTLHGIVADISIVKTLKDSIETSINALYARLKVLEEQAEVTPTVPDPPPITSTISVMNYGADATGVNYSTVAFKNALTYAKSVGKKVYVPSGTFKLKWWGEDWTEATDEMNPSLLVGNFEGVGDIVIDKFPQPGNRDTNFNVGLISSKYENCFGKFNMKDINNPMIMDMHLTHEERSNIDMYHTNFGPTKRGYDPESDGTSHPRINCWGGVMLRYSKVGNVLPVVNINVNIGKMGLIVYQNGVWTMMENPYCQDGALFEKTFTVWNAGSGGVTRTTFDDYVQYNLPLQELDEYCLHFWSPDMLLTNPTTAKYVVAFLECWLDPSSAQYAEYLCFNCGVDMITPVGVSPKDHDEFATGRAASMTTTRKFCYVHNVRYFETDSVFNDSGLYEMIANKTITIW